MVDNPSLKGTSLPLGSDGRVFPTARITPEDVKKITPLTEAPKGNGGR